MRIESIVPSLELCQRLHKLGYDQGDSYFYWEKSPYQEGWSLFTNSDSDIHMNSWVAAPTVSELESRVHALFNEYAVGWNDSACEYMFSYGGRGAGCFVDGCHKTFWTDRETGDETYADAWAEFSCYLLENKLVEGG